MISEIFKGRPNDKREAREERCYNFLDNLGIDHDRVDHDPADTMEKCAEIGKKLGTDIKKNLFLCNTQKTKFYLLVMPADKVFKTKYLSKQINSARLSFASADDMLKYLDLYPGACSILGLINDTENEVKLIIDKDILSKNEISCHPCKSTSTIRFSIKDMFEKFLPAVNHEATIVDLPNEAVCEKI